MKAADIYYDLTSLPALVSLGGDPPIRPSELMDRFSSEQVVVELMRAIFLENDLLLRESLLSGYIKEVKGEESLVLSKSQLEGSEPLPEYLSRRTDATYLIEADYIWDSYFRYLLDVSSRLGVDFLAKWARFDLTLRNAIARERANRLKIEPEGYIVASDLEDKELELSEVISSWSGAEDPVDAQKIITMARWQWVCENDFWYTFRLDELAVYAVKLSLVDYWRRLVL